jgi:signal transduction histidine kinase
MTTLEECLESGQYRVPGDERFASALPRLVAGVARADTTAAVASRIAGEFACVLGARTASVYLRTADRWTLRLAGSANLDEATRSRCDSIRTTDDLPAARAVESGMLEITNAGDISPLRRTLDPRHVAHAGRGVAVGLPLFASGETIGAVSAAFDEFPSTHAAALGTLSDSLGAILDRARLRDEVGRLAATLRLREGHSALVAHDLRQPLNVILLNAAALARRGDAGDKTNLDRLQRGGSRLNRMISDLNDVSYVESGHFRLAVALTDVVALVKTVVAGHGPSTLISVEGEIPRMHVDPHRIEQVLSNILTNAEKYGRSGAAPRIEVRRDARAVLVSVSNEGGAIREEERTKVFDPYYRTHDHKPEVPGLGLGLYICRRLIEEHGGRIWTDSESSRTRFTFSLPIARSSSAGLRERSFAASFEPASVNGMTAATRG